MPRIAVESGTYTVDEAAIRGEMEDLASPVGAFVREVCYLDPAASIGTKDLFAAWCDWYHGNGQHAGTEQTFGRDLRAAVPSLKTVRKREGGDFGRVYSGIRLRTAADAEAAPDLRNGASVPHVPRCAAALPIVLHAKEVVVDMKSEARRDGDEELQTIESSAAHAAHRGTPPPPCTGNGAWFLNQPFEVRRGENG